MSKSDGRSNVERVHACILDIVVCGECDAVGDE